MDLKEKKLLKKMASKIRIDILEMLCASGSGHSGGSLSMADVFAYLYFSGKLKLDPQNPKMANRDRVVLSKGACLSGFVCSACRKGLF